MFLYAKQFPHLFLRKPYRLVLKPNFKLWHSSLIEFHDLA